MTPCMICTCVSINIIIHKYLVLGLCTKYQGHGVTLLKLYLQVYVPGRGTDMIHDEKNDGQAAYDLS